MARHHNREAESGVPGPNDSDINLVSDNGTGSADNSGPPRAADRQADEDLASERRLNAILDGRPAKVDASKLAEKLLDVAVRDFGHPDDPLKITHPTLASFLFQKTWNKIELRESAVITITVSPVGVAGSLKMPSEAQQLTSRCSFVSEILDRLEYDLTHTTGEWKELKSGPGAQKIRENRKKMVEIEKSKK